MRKPAMGNPNSFGGVMTTALDMIEEFKIHTTGPPAEFAMRVHDPGQFARQTRVSALYR